MDKLIAFLSSFTSYLLLFGIFVLLAGVAVFAGITMRKRKNAKELAEADSVEETENTTNE